jgi:ligand-binding sensor domain-containing protein
MCINEDDEGTLWIGTYGGGLNRLQDGKFIRISKEEGLPDDTIYCILEDRKHFLWMSSNRGIFYIKPREIENFARGKSKTLKPLYLAKRMV